jgi:hypothetical protein
MNHLEIIEIEGMRVLTTSQLAESYGTDYKVISKNFTRNKIRYQGKKHFITLTGADRRDFMNNRQIDDSLKHAHTIYLWTKQGALLHAKSLNTDQAWDAYQTLLDDYFSKVEEAKQPQQDISSASPQLQYLFMMEQRQVAIEAKQTALEAKQSTYDERLNGMDEVKDAVTALTDNMIAAPDHTKVVSTVNEFARWTRIGHNEVYNKIYETLKSAHGIDVRQRVENERERIQKDYNAKTGKFYSESTLKSKVNGIDVMVRLGCLDKFNTILVGMLAKEKSKSNLRLVQ